jgi:rubrerythrin
LKFPQIFLTHIQKDQKEFLNLLDLTAKVHGENRHTAGKVKSVIWDEDFFQLKTSTIWKGLTLDDRKTILISLGEKILQEAYFIECSGMAHAGKMNLTAKTKEEREFFCFVAEEEAKHLRMVENLASFNTSLENIPSFAMLIGEIIQEASKPSLLLLIQILLEGWGLNYYKSLVKTAKDENVAAAFKAILKDEIRHHSAGVILFSAHLKQNEIKETEAEEFLGYLERIAFMVKIGPYNAAEECFKRSPHKNKEDLKNFLMETDAVSITSGKMELLGQLLSKSLPDDLLEQIQSRKLLKALDLNEMTEVLFQSMPGTFSPDED